MHDWKKYWTTDNIVKYTGIFFVLYASVLIAIDLVIHVVGSQTLEASGILTLWSLLIAGPLFIGALISIPALAIGKVTAAIVGTGLLVLMVLIIAGFIIATFFRVPIVGIPWVRIALVLWFVLIVWQGMSLAFNSWCQVKGTCVQGMYNTEEAKELKVTKMFREKFPEYRYVEDTVHGYTLRVYANSNEKTYLDIPLQGQEPVLYCLVDQEVNGIQVYTSQKQIRTAIQAGYCQ